MTGTRVRVSRRRTPTGRAGTYTIKLTVTDTANLTDSVSHQVTVATAPASNISFIGEADSNGNTTNPTVTVPPGACRPGDVLVLFASYGHGTPAPSTPAGWTLVDSRTSCRGCRASCSSRVAGAGDAGSSLPVPTGTLGKTVLMLAAVSRCGHRDAGGGTVTDPWGASDSVSKQVTVVDGILSNTAPPTISGTAQVGVKLTADPGSWSVSGTTYSYQWNAGGTAVGTTAKTYTPVPGDLGKTITVTVTASATGYATPRRPARRRRRWWRGRSRTPCCPVDFGDRAGRAGADRGPGVLVAGRGDLCLPVVRRRPPRWHRPSDLHPGHRAMSTRRSPSRSPHRRPGTPTSAPARPPPRWCCRRPPPRWST